MTVVTIHKAKTELSKLLARVEAGEEIVIARGDEPIAKLVALTSSEKKDPPAQARSFGASTWQVACQSLSGANVRGRIGGMGGQVFFSR